MELPVVHDVRGIMSCCFLFCFVACCRSCILERYECIDRPLVVQARGNSITPPSFWLSFESLCRQYTGCVFAEFLIIVVLGLSSGSAANSITVVSRNVTSWHTKNSIVWSCSCVCAEEEGRQLSVGGSIAGRCAYSMNILRASYSYPEVVVFFVITRFLCFGRDAIDAWMESTVDFFLA